MARRIDLTDWDISVGESAVLARPSGRVVGFQLWISALCAAIIVFLVWACGIPPGSKKVSRARDRIAAMQQQAEDIERKARRLSTGAGDTSRNMADRESARAAALREQIVTEAAKVDVMQPTLGPGKDAAFWVSICVCVLIGVGLPVSSKFERVTMMVKGDTLRIRSFCSFNRGGAFKLHHFTAIAVHARRIAVRDHETGSIQDAGWLWTVYVGNPQQPVAPALEVRTESSNMLPPRIEQMTGPTRDLVRFFQRHTDAVVADTVTTDVSNIEATARGTRKRLKTRRHGPLR